ncbi:MAG: radical SAM protein, partial [Tumebacillaceae bacterium]
MQQPAVTAAAKRFQATTNTKKQGSVTTCLTVSPSWAGGFPVLGGRFNFRSRNSNDELVVYNSYTGAVGIVPQDQEAEVIEALKPTSLTQNLNGILQDLREGGLLVPSDEDEFEKAAQLHRETFQATDRLWLIIMPTEECNFRCVYCYEEFKVKEMKPDIREGIKKFVLKQAANLKYLHVSWFGGEPTEAPEVIVELSKFFLDLCEEYGIAYDSAITTNGYNLKPELARMLIEDCKITFYNITVDGMKEEHDQRRILKGGGETFETIIDNMIKLKATEMEFKVQLRTNFDKHSRDEVPKFMDYVVETFERDHRFAVFYQTIGKWGGPNDGILDVCDGTQGTKDMYNLHKQAKHKGLPQAIIAESLGPTNSVCYAALPHSLVFGANGVIYKCTLALDKEYNKVGQIDAGGNLNLDQDRFEL